MVPTQRMGVTGCLRTGELISDMMGAKLFSLSFARNRSCLSFAVYAHS